MASVPAAFFPLSFIVGNGYRNLEMRWKEHVARHRQAGGTRQWS